MLYSSGRSFGGMRLASSQGCSAAVLNNQGLAPDDWNLYHTLYLSMPSGIKSGYHLLLHKQTQIEDFSYSTSVHVNRFLLTADAWLSEWVRLTLQHLLFHVQQSHPRSSYCRLVIWREGTSGSPVLKMRSNNSDIVLSTNVGVPIRLRRAIHLNDLTLVKRIVKKHGEKIQNPDFDDKGNTTLHLAAALGFLEIAVRPRTRGPTCVQD